MLLFRVIYIHCTRWALSYFLPFSYKVYIDLEVFQFCSYTAIRISVCQVCFSSKCKLVLISNSCFADIVLLLAQQSNAGQGRLIDEVSESHTRHTKVSRTSRDEGPARYGDIYLRTQTHLQQTDGHIPGGIRTHSSSKRSTPDLHSATEIGTRMFCEN